MKFRKISKFNKYWSEHVPKISISLNKTICYFANKYENIPESYIKFITEYNGMFNDSYYKSVGQEFGVLLSLESGNYSIESVLRGYNNHESFSKHKIIPFSVMPWMYEWCFNFDILKDSQPTISKHTWQSYVNDCDDEFGIVQNTNLTFDEFISKLKCEED